MDSPRESERLKEPRGALSIEQIFDEQKLPTWREQITVRALFVSVVIGFVFSIIMMKLNLTTGLAVTMNVPAGLLGFIFITSLNKALRMGGFSTKPFTRQENTVIQTCVVACYSISYGGGFGSYLLGMNRKTYEQSGGGLSLGNTPETIKEPGVPWMMGFLFLTTFVGLFVLLPLRKVLIVNPKLTYPSGTATAVLINGFHTPKGHKLARQQVKCFLKFFSGSFLWGFFQWFYTGGDGCGFVNFPTFGLQAWRQTFYFDFSMTYVGAGMICPHIVNVSLLIGAVLSWGLFWPLIRNQKGNWYSEDLKESSMKSLNGYKIFITVAVILGDGLYHMTKVTYITIKTIYTERKHKKEVAEGIQPYAEDTEDSNNNTSYDEKRRKQVFMNDTISMHVAWVGYVVLAVISMLTIPRIFTPMRWYHVATAYAAAPFLAFSNAYGTGLTDQNLAYNYSKAALFAFAAWAGTDNGGVLVGLVACGLMKSMIASASDLMHDFKTGYLTLSSPRAMFIAQVVGTAMGCVVGPTVFWMFYKGFDIGNPDGEYKAPYALVYRNMAILGVEGFSALPKHCLQICYFAFAAAIAVNGFRDWAPRKVARYVPLPMAMAIPMLVGGYFAVDMCIGSLVVFVWQKMNKGRSELFVPGVASGLLCGDGIWLLPAAVLALMKVNPPVCMKFLSRADNLKVASLVG